MISDGRGLDHLDPATPPPWPSSPRAARASWSRSATRARSAPSAPAASSATWPGWSSPASSPRSAASATPLDRRIVELAHDGRGSDALDLLRAEGRLRIADTIEALDGHRPRLARRLRRGRRRGDDRPPQPRRRRAQRRGPRAPTRRRAGWGPRRSGSASATFAAGDRVMTRINTAEVSNRERWGVSARRPRAPGRSSCSESAAIGARSPSTPTTWGAGPKAASRRSSTPTR